MLNSHLFKDAKLHIATRWRCYLENNVSSCSTHLSLYSFSHESYFLCLPTLIMFPFKVFTHVGAQHSHVCTQQNEVLKLFICLSDQKYCDLLNTLRSPLCSERHFIPSQTKGMTSWVTHLMCALNIRWGRKGSIQEFSTLLRAPGLPSQPSQATLRTRTGWNRPPSPQQQHTQQERVHWTILAGDKTARWPSPSPAPDLWAAATAARLLHPASLIYSRIPSTENQPSAKLQMTQTTFPDETQHVPT